jgi:anaerobic carbon-monoxide dehydrogenase iron sulfur subunit
MSRFISVNPTVCTGCKTCEVACSLFHFGECNPLRSAIRIIRRERGGLVTSLPLVCQQCRQAFCIEACPAHALSREGGDAALTLDEQKCSSCGNCVDACPAGCIFLDNETNLPVSCDLCSGQPQCVMLCHSNCLTFVNDDNADDPDRIKRLAGLLEAEDLTAKSTPGKGWQ